MVSRKVSGNALAAMPLSLFPCDDKWRTMGWYGEEEGDAKGARLRSVATAFRIALPRASPRRRRVASGSRPRTSGAAAAPRASTRRAAAHRRSPRLRAQHSRAGAPAGLLVTRWLAVLYLRVDGSGGIGRLRGRRESGRGAQRAPGADQRMARRLDRRGGALPLRRRHRRRG